MGSQRVRHDLATEQQQQNARRNKSDRERQYCMISKKYNKLVDKTKKEAEPQIEQTSGYHWGSERGAYRGGGMRGTSYWV